MIIKTNPELQSSTLGVTTAMLVGLFMSAMPGWRDWESGMLSRILWGWEERELSIGCGSPCWGACCWVGSAWLVCWWKGIFRFYLVYIVQKVYISYNLQLHSVEFQSYLKMFSLVYKRGKCQME